MPKFCAKGHRLYVSSLTGAATVLVVKPGKTSKYLFRYVEFLQQVGGWCTHSALSHDDALRYGWFPYTGMVNKEWFEP